MNIREYEPGDEKFLRAMHASQGFEYELPDLADPRLWITRQVLTRADGLAVMAVLGRLTSEAFLLEDRAQRVTDGRRARRFLALAERACDDGRRMGIDSCHVWPPPEIEAKFGAQLERRGWQRFTWPTYMRVL